VGDAEFRDTHFFCLPRSIVAEVLRASAAKQSVVLRSARASTTALVNGATAKASHCL